jgi:hypothetical protein
MPSFWNINRQWGRGFCGFRGPVGGLTGPSRTARGCGGGDAGDPVGDAGGDWG